MLCDPRLGCRFETGDELSAVRIECFKGLLQRQFGAHGAVGLELEEVVVGQGPVPGKPAERKGVKATTEDSRKILIYEDGTWEIAPKEIFNIPVGDSYFIGPKDAKVTVMEWMDYQ